MKNVELCVAIKESGLKKGAIAQRLGISTASLNNKLNGVSEFYFDEALTIMRMLGKPEHEIIYFFDRKVN